MHAHHRASNTMKSSDKYIVPWGQNQPDLNPSSRLAFGLFSSFTNFTFSSDVSFTPLYFGGLEDFFKVLPHIIKAPIKHFKVWHSTSKEYTPFVNFQLPPWGRC